MPDVKIGDRVRVVLEGEAQERFGNGGFVLGDHAQNLIIPEWDHVVSVEVLSRRPQVGDVIKAQTYVDREAEDDFPVGTVVAYSSGDNALSKRSNGKWSHVDEEGENYPLAAPNWDDLTVIFVPHEA